MASLLKHRTKGSIVFDSINGIFMVLLSFTTLYPFLFLLFQSLGNSASISLLPTEFNTVAYVSVFKNSYIWSGFYNTIRRTFVGTVLSVLVTTFAAYALSKPWFPNRRFWTGLIVFTMFFSGGMIPSYLLIRGLGLYNSFWSMILPGLCSAYNMTIMRNFFMSIPFELEESAKIDGANDIQVMLRIVIPISLPILATVSLWNAVGHWNAWFDCMIYITEPRNQVLQLILRHRHARYRNLYAGSSQSGHNHCGNPANSAGLSFYPEVLCEGGNCRIFKGISAPRQGKREDNREKTKERTKENKKP